VLQKLLTASVMAAALLAGKPAFAANSDAAQYARSSEYYGVKTSPDGDRLATIVRVDGRLRLNIIDLATLKSLGAFGITGDRDQEKRGSWFLQRGQPHRAVREDGPVPGRQHPADEIGFRVALRRAAGSRGGYLGPPPTFAHDEQRFARFPSAGGFDRNLMHRSSPKTAGRSKFRALTEDAGASWAGFRFSCRALGHGTNCMSQLLFSGQDGMLVKSFPSILLR